MIVTAGIIVRDGKFLLSRRREGDSGGGVWEFAGGKVEKGETAEEGICRELQEELGVRARALALYDIIAVSPDRFILFYICHTNDIPQTLECAQVEWVAPEDLLLYPTHPSDLKIMHSIQKDYHVIFDIIQRKTQVM